jgi:glycosyltransferase involved in cell wall biosynthesis
MKITYLANIRLPTQKAHGLQIMKTCEALAKEGVEVNLVVPTRHNKITEDPFSFYGVDSCFTITKIKTPDLVAFGFLGFVFSLICFAERSIWYSFWNKGDVWYSRDLLLASLMAIFCSHVVWESHEGKTGLLVAWLRLRQVKLVVITEGGKTFYQERGFSPENILVAPDAVDVTTFNSALSITEARQKVGLSQLNSNQKIVAYVGSVALYDWKGVDVFLSGLGLAIKQNASIVGLVVGGTAVDHQNLIKQFELSDLVAEQKIIFVPQVKPALVPAYLRAASILVIPNKKGNQVSEQFTSPMKLFEYMASGVPIISTDVPAIVEVLNEDIAYVVPANNGEALAQAIAEILRNEAAANNKATKAQVVVDRYSWANRGQELVNFLNHV